MASFTGVGDNVELQMADKGEAVAIALSGTYDMTIAFQREVGSPGSGAWQTLRTYSTAAATVAETHVTELFNEKLRLIVLIDTSGTATATLTDSVLEGLDYLTIRDRLGGALVSHDQGGIRFQKGVSVGAPVAITAATFTVTREHAGRMLRLDLAAGIAVTLPDASGTGDHYSFYVATTFTGAAAIAVSRAADTFVAGSQAILSQDGVDTLVSFSAAATDDTVDLFDTGNVGGGLVGGIIEFWDVAPNKWLVRLTGDAAGIEATPFKATV